MRTHMHTRMHMRMHNHMDMSMDMRMVYRIRSVYFIILLYNFKLLNARLKGCRATS